MHQKDDSPASVQSYLKGVDYPATTKDLIAVARKNGAPEDVLKVLQEMPDDQFDGPPGVMKAYGKIR